MIFVMLLIQASNSIKSVQNLFLLLNSEKFRSFLFYFSQESIIHNIQGDLYEITNNLIEGLTIFPPYATPTIPHWFDFLFFSDVPISSYILHIFSHHFPLNINYIWGYDKHILSWGWNEIIHTQNWYNSSI